MSSSDLTYDPQTDCITAELNLIGSWSERVQVIGEWNNVGLTVTGGGMKMKTVTVSGSPEKFRLAGEPLASVGESAVGQHRTSLEHAARDANPDASKAKLHAYLDARARIHARRVQSLGTPIEKAVAAVASPDGTGEDLSDELEATEQAEQAAYDAYLAGGEDPFLSKLGRDHHILEWQQRVWAAHGQDWETSLASLAWIVGHYGSPFETSHDGMLPELVKLAQKHARPDEQILAAAQFNAVSHKMRTRRVQMVVFTHGFAVKDRGPSARIDVRPKFMALNDEGAFSGMKVSITLGEHDLDFQDGAVMFDVLWLQRTLQQAGKSAPALAPSGPSPVTDRSSGHPRPAERLIRTARDAELIAAEWMTYWGYTHVVTTPVGVDGGVDVHSDEAVAQVKAEAVPTGGPKVQQHHGVAVSHGKQALFFSLAGYTPAARTFAEANAMLLFSFDLQGVPDPVNPAAHMLVQRVELMG